MWMGPGPAPSNCTINYGYGPEISIPVRQEGRAMYVWNDNEDQLLFDFDMQVGEMLPLSFNNADPNIEVVDLDSIQLDGEWRRVFSISGGLAVTIVEGIGSDKGFFEPVSDIFECGHNLTCFSLNGESVYPGPDCEIIMAIDGLEEQDIDIRFDATSSVLTVLMPGFSAALPLEVLDVHGRLCHRTRLNGTGGQVNLAALSAGTYLVRIGARTERFVVSRN